MKNKFLFYIFLLATGFICRPTILLAEEKIDNPNFIIRYYDWGRDYAASNYFKIILNPSIIFEKDQFVGVSDELLAYHGTLFPFISFGIGLGADIFLSNSENETNFNWYGINLYTGFRLPLIGEEYFSLNIFGDGILQIGYSEARVYNYGFDAGIVFLFEDAIGIELKYRGLFHLDNRYINSFGVAFVGPVLYKNR